MAMDVPKINNRKTRKNVYLDRSTFNFYEDKQQGDSVYSVHSADVVKCNLAI